MPKSKKELTNALLKWVYGIEVLDEYRYQQVALIGNTCFIIYFFGSLASMAVSVGLMRSKLDWAMDFLLFSHLGLFFVTVFYLTQQCRKRELLVVEVLPEEYEAEKSKRLKRLRRNSIFYFVGYLTFNSFMDNGFHIPELLADMIAPENIIHSLLTTLTIYSILRYQTLKNIRILTEETN